MILLRRSRPCYGGVVFCSLPPVVFVQHQTTSLVNIFRADVFEFLSGVVSLISRETAQVGVHQRQHVEIFVAVALVSKHRIDSFSEVFAVSFIEVAMYFLVKTVLEVVENLVVELFLGEVIRLRERSYRHSHFRELIAEI